jgi:hypothetical protein
VQKLLTHTIQHIERNPFLVSLYEKRKNKKIGSKEKKKKTSERYVYNTVSPRSGKGRK